MIVNKKTINQSMTLILGCVYAEYLFQKLIKVFSIVIFETSTSSDFLVTGFLVVVYITISEKLLCLLTCGSIKILSFF
jgi:hypothetical protein